MTASTALLYGHRDQPRGIHALIVGVGGYSKLAPAGSPNQPIEPPFFNLKQLQSACPAAIRLAKLLESLHTQKGLRLGTCRLLATPVPGGRGAGFCKDHNVPRARLDLLIEAAQAWRKDAANDPEGLLLFYFAGHGLQRDLKVIQGIEQPTRRTEQLALLEDFGMPSAQTSTTLSRPRIWWCGAFEPRRTGCLDNKYSFLIAAEINRPA